MLGKKASSQVVKPVLTPTKAQEVYSKLLEEDRDITNLFIKHGLNIEDSITVSTEMDKLEAEMVSKMNGSFELTALVPEVLDEDGNVKTPAIPATYYKVTSESELVKSVSSNLLDIATIVTDVRKWNKGTPKVSENWSTYKASFTSKEG